MVILGTKQEITGSGGRAERQEGGVEEEPDLEENFLSPSFWILKARSATICTVESEMVIQVLRQADVHGGAARGGEGC